MAEPTTATPAAETAPPATGQNAIAEAVAAALAKEKADRKAKKKAKAAESAKPAAPVTESDDERIARIVEERAAKRIADEVKPPVAETEDQRIERLVEARVTAEKQRLVAGGGVTPARKGVEAPVNEHTAAKVGGGEPATNGHGLPAGWPDKELHKYSPDELAQYGGSVLDQHIFGRSGRAVSDIPA